MIEMCVDIKRVKRSQHGDELINDAHRETDGDARPKPKDLDVGNGSERAEQTLELARRQTERITAREQDITNLPMSANVRKRRTEPLKRKLLFIADDAAPVAMATI